MLDRFIAECSHSQLSDPRVAKEALYLLRNHPNITTSALADGGDVGDASEHRNG